MDVHVSGFKTYAEFALTVKQVWCCRGRIRSREAAFGVEDEDEPSQGTQSRVVRQRSNPEQPSELTSVRELLQEVSQEAHEGSVWFSEALSHMPLSEN